MLAHEHNRTCRERAAKQFVVTVGGEADASMAAEQEDFLDVTVAKVDASRAKDQDLKLLGK
jgi:hypothetical protein